MADKQQKQKRIRRVPQRFSYDFTGFLIDNLSGGYSLASHLQVLAAFHGGKNVIARMLIHLAEQVRERSHLSEALRVYPKVFSSLYVNMVAAGEGNGNLLSSLRGLHEYLRLDALLRERRCKRGTPRADAKIEMTRALSALGILLAYGVPVYDALEIAAEEVGARLGDALLTVRARLESDETYDVGQAFSVTPIFPRVACDILGGFTRRDPFSKGTALFECAKTEAAMLGVSIN